MSESEQGWPWGYLPCGCRNDWLREPRPMTEQAFRPSWVTDDEPMPDPQLCDPLEAFVAGALSTLPPFDVHHPAWAIPHAKQALRAVMEWEPEP